MGSILEWTGTPNTIVIRILQPNNTSYTRGKAAESYAVKFLLKQGLILIAQNYRCPFGEVDAIMRAETTTVFIEVRYRARINFGSPLESITASKLKKLHLTVKYFFMENQNLVTFPARFDLFLLTGQLSNPSVEWLQDAIIFNN